MKRVAFILTIHLLGFAANAAAEVLSLRTAEQKALENSFEIRIQDLEERSKTWEKRNTYAGYMPSIGYGLTYMQMDDSTVARANVFSSMSSIPGFPPLEVDPQAYDQSFSHELSVNQVITNGGREFVAIGMARHMEKAVAQSRITTTQDIIYQTRKAYYDAINASHMVVLAESSSVLAQINLEATKIREQSGSIPKTDLVRWEAEVIKTEGDLARARSMRQIAMIAIYHSMGVHLESVPDDVALEELPVFEKSFASLPGQLEGNIEQSPQLRFLRAMQRVAKGSRNMAFTQFLPRLNAFYNTTWPARDEFAPWAERKGWTAGLALNVPIFSGFRNSTGFKSASYAYEKSRIEHSRTENLLELDLKRIELSFVAAIKATKAARKQQALMETQLAMLQERYHAGLVNQSQLLETQMATQQVRMGYVQKLFECLLLYAEHKKTLGKLEVGK